MRRRDPAPPRQRRSLDPGRRARLLPGLFALVLVLLLPGTARASGRIRTFGLEMAVRGASYVLLVALAKPGRETRELPIPYQKEGKERQAQMSTTFLRLRVLDVLYVAPEIRGTISGRSYLRPGKEVRVDRGAVAQKGKTVRLIEATTPIYHAVRARRLADGTRKIPFLPALAGSLEEKQLQPGKRYVLLAGFDLRYEALVGVGDWGLLPASRLARVKALLPAPEPADPAPDLPPTRPPATPKGAQ